MTAHPTGPLILYITNGFPYPLTSGYLRHYFLIGRLADAGCRVILLSIAGVDHRPEHTAAMADRTERVEVFASTDRSRGTRHRWMRRLRRVLPVGGGDPAGIRLAARAARIVESEPIDAVVFSGRRTDRALAALEGLPMVVDMCDATSLRLGLEMTVADRPRRIALRLQRAQVRRTEARMLARADRLLFASARDREALMPGAHDPRAAIVPNGVDIGYWSRTTRNLGRGEIVFTGAMSYGPNVDAAIRLARHILPIVQASIPAARLAIVGRDPSPSVAALASLPGVRVTGSVPDMRPYLQEAAVFAAPLRFGAGIQNKLLEAMAMEVPSVVSTIAGDGLRTEAGDLPPIAVADDDGAFAAALVDVLRRVGDDPSPDGEARAFVTRHFSWERCGRVLLDQIDAARADRRPDRPAPRGG
jgi:glycosyltransferase involved in cell wall biosynthesis